MQHQLKKAAFFGHADQIKRVYKQGREQVAAATNLYPHIVNGADFEAHVPHLQDLEVIFSTWGMPPLTEGQIAQLPRLQAVFYAAGSVQGFARPFLERHVLVVSAWAANAVPVAEFTLA
jgi:phosphoglycerate dehydrogenase-like enzyme